MSFRDLVEGRLGESVQGDFQLKIRKAKKGECAGIMKDIEAAFKDKKINEKEFDMLTAMCGRKMDQLDERFSRDKDYKVKSDKIYTTKSNFKNAMKDYIGSDKKSYLALTDKGSTLLPVEFVSDDELAKILKESQDKEVVLGALADADINASIEGDTVIVDKDDMTATKKVLKKIGCSRKVKSGLNEGEEDVIFSKKMDGQELKVHVHDGKFICKLNGKELK